MTRKELIDKLIDEFEKDKEVIKQNMLLAMDTIYLETKDNFEKITLQIKIERIEDNENTK